MHLNAIAPDFVPLELCDKYSKSKWADLACVLFMQLDGEDTATYEDLEQRMKEEINLYNMRHPKK